MPTRITAGRRSRRLSAPPGREALRALQFPLPAPGGPRPPVAGTDARSEPPIPAVAPTGQWIRCPPAPPSCCDRRLDHRVVLPPAPGLVPRIADQALDLDEGGAVRRSRRGHHVLLHHQAAVVVGPEPERHLPHL